LENSFQNPESEQVVIAFAGDREQQGYILTLKATPLSFVGYFLNLLLSRMIRPKTGEILHGHKTKLRE
jgi:hypothetical protein